MTGKKIGYVRVSSVDKNTIRQLDGIALDKVFTEKLSGQTIERPILLECMTYIRSGDTLYVHRSMYAVLTAWHAIQKIYSIWLSNSSFNK